MKKVLGLILVCMLMALPVHAGGKILVTNDVTRALEEVEGSDGRMNVSSRSDSRSYYVSRDNGQVYTFNSEFDAVSGQEVIYIKNTSSTKKLFISQIILGAGSEADWEVFEVTSGTAAGTSVTPKNLNLSSSNDAASTVFGNAQVTGSLSGDTISHIISSSATSVRLSYGDALILGQNDDISITYSSSASSEVEVTVQGFFE